MNTKKETSAGLLAWRSRRRRRKKTEEKKRKEEKEKKREKKVRWRAERKKKLHKENTEYGEQDKIRTFKRKT